ncbi:MAG: tryptophan synthase alpha chain [Actinomycetota bacterium]|jgi:tryptophan synthase alpha chain|nr:tryptophan synthase alpha chain [Actinomycetota bacterium]
MSVFFADRPSGHPGLALFLNAGDPPLDVFRELVLMLDANRVDCLELAIPFPNSPSDGPVIQQSAQRALDDGVDRKAVMDFVAEVRPHLQHTKIALLADYRYSIKDMPLREFLEWVKATGADGLLVHGMPPRVRPGYYEEARSVGQPIVTTCYSSSEPPVIEEAADNASAYIYLVSAYGRSGTVGPPDHSVLTPVMETMRARSDVPIAVGFGVKTREDIAGLGAAGADAAIVGSSCVARVAAAREAGRDVVQDFHGLLVELGAAGEPAETKSAD